MMSTSQSNLKLYMILLGSKAPGRHVEQHDYFFGIAAELKELVPAIRAFWAEAGNNIHIDAWREVTQADGYSVKVVPRVDAAESKTEGSLFFINLGGYLHGRFEEQHYVRLTVQPDHGQAIQEAKRTAFYHTNSIKGGQSHIDDKYAIDVDDISKIEDLLSAEQRENYALLITKAGQLPEDEIHLGYLKLDKLLSNNLVSE